MLKNLLRLKLLLKKLFHNRLILKLFSKIKHLPIIFFFNL
jgi:hypothetical protein